MAALNSTIATADVVDTATATAPGSFDLSGMWHSRYLYVSSGRNRELEGQHYVVFRQVSTQITGQSLPHTMESEMRLSGMVGTGSWTEHTSPGGYYRGAVYHGTMQLLVYPMGRSMSGKWLGFGKGFKINRGGLGDELG